ncbi:hypothetical protein ACHQM5_002295 [Ranunculus cassubicifolius]
MVAIWRNRNAVVFEGQSPSLVFCKGIIRKYISHAAVLSSGSAFQNQQDQETLQSLGIPAKFGKAPKVKKCIWLPPEMGQVKGNVDGASAGNPGPAGIGVSFRDHNGEFLAVRAKGIGIENNYWAESLAIVEAMEFSLQQGWLHLWLESDCSPTVYSFNVGAIPWKLVARFKKAKRQFQSFTITHLWREGNIAADLAAKHGSTLAENETVTVFGKPDWITSWEVPFKIYYRFD